MPRREKQARGESVVGREYDAEVGPVAHGGHAVARVEGRAVFVRHALPGERVTLRVTEGSEGDRFWRADAVRVLTPSPDRVPPPCPVAGPGLCGGCDLQHVALPAQREWKAAVVREQLVRVGGLDPDHDLVAGLKVERVGNPRPEGDPDDGLRWRTRTRFARTPDGRPGLRAHRSHAVIPVEDCLITMQPQVRDGVREVTAAGVTHRFSLASDGFWQVHPKAPRVLVETVLAMVEPEPGESVLDLYGGVGLFAAFFADHVGEAARVCLVEGDAQAAAHARDNLPTGARVFAGDVATVLSRDLDAPFDLVVLDPPRVGAKRRVVEQIVDRAPRAVAYVACDPAALARDVAIFAEHGYELQALRAFDLFPMTHHVECVALLQPERPNL